jgi:hypothetical protein
MFGGDAWKIYMFNNYTRKYESPHISPMKWYLLGRALSRN